MTFRVNCTKAIMRVILEQAPEGSPNFCFGIYATRYQDGYKPGQCVLFVQSDWDWAGLASSLGWCPCECGLTDGTVDCKHNTTSEIQLMTTQTAISDARQLADELTAALKPHGVIDVSADDWSDYFLFSFIASLDVNPNHGIKVAFRPNDPKTFNLRKINSTIKRVCKTHNLEPNIESPPNVYYVTKDAPKEWEGYDREHVRISIRFPDDSPAKPKIPDYDFNKWYQETYN